MVELLLLAAAFLVDVAYWIAYAVLFLAVASVFLVGVLGLLETRRAPTYSGSECLSRLDRLDGVGRGGSR